MVKLYIFHISVSTRLVCRLRLMTRPYILYNRLIADSDLPPALIKLSRCCVHSFTGQYTQRVLYKCHSVTVMIIDLGGETC